ncbi:cyclin-dependent kinase inhibitor 4-like [Curcuma longa]|uniref:cyclin-dependent kinase inhibitor 4-like n=1 Tax=Curcuma longa TaxID=136217 RepID=UPI003D9DD487
MGKYMRKARLTGDVALVELASYQPSIGVRTRARALAAASATASAPQDSSLAYLELRSRRLEKTLSPPHSFKPKVTPPKESSTIKANPGISPLNVGTLNSGREGSFGSRNSEKGCSPVAEVSCAENNIEPESRERETTPCSLIRDSETIGTPGSSTRSTNSIARKKGMQNSVNQYIPSNQETEEFFVRLEKLQQQIFIDKYNFDPVNDCPLPGRYEWIKPDS